MIEYRYPTLEEYCKRTGLKIETARGYMKRGIWVNGDQYIKPTGDKGIVFIDLKGIEKWGEAAAALEKPAKQQLKSVSRIETSGAAQGSSLSPRPLI